MASIWSGGFWKATGERALRTAAQAATLVLVGEAYESAQLNALELDWFRVLGFGLGGALLSALTSIAGNATSQTGPSFSKSETVRLPGSMSDDA